MDRFRNQCRLPNSPIRLSGSNPCKIDEFTTLEKDWSKSGKTPFIMIKNGDCKKFREKIKDFNLDNTLLLVDESHYGTRDYDSQFNQLLREFEKDFSGDPNKLQKNHTYILSVSATPYNEEYADKVDESINKALLKRMIPYKPGKGYIGYANMCKLGIIQGLKGNSHVTDKTIFTKFLKEQREKMDNIMLETNGQRHAVIIRMQGKKTLLSSLGEKALAKIANKNGFKMMVVDCNNTSKKNIDYDNAYKEIKYSQFDGGNNILIIVRQGFSYGISIPDNIKPLISTIYDYRPNYALATPDSTEQGLLGRMTGYHPNGISKYLKIYISEDHKKGLDNFYCKWPPAESPMTSKSLKNSVEKTPCSFEEWNNGVYADKDDKRKHIDLWNNENRKPLIYNGKIVDDFFARHNEFNYDSLFSKTKSKGSSFLTEILTAFNKEVLSNRFDDKLYVDARRQTGVNPLNDSICSKLGYTTPILSNTSRWKWRDAKNAGREGWAFIVDITKAKGKKGIEIRIPYGTIGFSKDTNIETYRERKVYKGYQSELALAMAAQD